MLKHKIERIKKHYGFTSRDELVLMKLADTIEGHQTDFVETFYEHIEQFDQSGDHLKTQKIIERHKQALQHWFVKLFRGPFDSRYFSYLEGIGYTHVKVGLPSHYVNASISFVREYCTSLLSDQIENRTEREEVLIAFGKILDINLDILTSSYIQEEVNLFFISKKAEGKLINFAKRFSYGLNLMLMMGLVLLGVIVLALFAHDASYILRGDLEKGLLGMLGALLMLWVVIELVDTEVEHLQGARFTIKVFIGVAMVAVIRKILITSLKTEEVEAQLSMIAALAVLGALFWVVSRIEKEQK